MVHREPHSTNRGIVVAESDFEVLDREQRPFRATHDRDTGSKASRNASPIIMKASTVIANAPAG